MRSPLLVVYILRGVEVTSAEAPEVPYRDGMLLPALRHALPGTPNPDAPDRLVHYQLNRVAQRQFLPEEEDEGDDIVDDADDVD